MKPVRAVFELGESASSGLTFKGYDSGRRWNGWAVPLLPRREIKRWCDAMGQACPEVMTYALVGDAVELCTPEGYVARFEPSMVETKSGKRELWEIDAGLTWAVVAGGMQYVPPCPAPEPRQVVEPSLVEEHGVGTVTEAAETWLRHYIETKGWDELLAHEGVLTAVLAAFNPEIRKLCESPPVCAACFEDVSTESWFEYEASGTPEEHRYCDRWHQGPLPAFRGKRS